MFVLAIQPYLNNEQSMDEVAVRNTYELAKKCVLCFEAALQKGRKKFDTLSAVVDITQASKIGFGLSLTAFAQPPRRRDCFWLREDDPAESAHCGLQCAQRWSS